MSQDTDSMRRNPTQKRANDTVDTILEATARIVEQGDKGQLTTNHIAERAGYSVGTLYGYFPNKQVLLRGLALREMRRQESRLLAALKAVTPEQSDEAVVRIVIHAALRPFEARSRLRIALMRLLARDEDIMAAIRSVQDHVLDLMLKAISARRPTPLQLSESRRFLLLASVAGAIQTAALERPDLFETTAFEDEVVAMAFHLLDSAPAASA
jgi:AcrR family transcriptional regulator